MNSNFFKSFADISSNLDLRQFWIVFSKYKKDLLLIPILFSLISIFISINIEKKYLSTATVVIKPDNNKNIGNIEEAYFSRPDSMSRINNQIAVFQSNEVIESILKNEEIIPQVNKILEDQHNKLNSMQKIFIKKIFFDKVNVKSYLKENFEVTNLPRSDILELSFASENPQVAEIFLRSLLDTYQKYEIDTKVIITSYANSKITERLTELSDQLDVSQSHLLKYEIDNNLINLANTKANKITEITEISKNIQDLKKSLIFMKSIYTLNHLKVIGAEELLSLNLQRLEQVNNELSYIQEKEVGLLKLQREHESIKKIYDTFIQRVKETNETRNLQVSNIQIIQEPNAPLYPISPNIIKNIILSYLFSFFILYILIFYREINRATIKDPLSIEAFELPLLGMMPNVPLIRKGFHLLQMYLEDSKSRFSDSVRSLKTSLEANFEKNKSYLITSGNPEEGKTTVAFNLALALEKQNKVLLIESDIRRPSVAKSYYRLRGTVHGFTDIITGEATFEKAINIVPGTNLHMITSGSKRYDFTDLVSVEQLKKFIRICTDEYDYVIIDSPPIIPVSDTLIITQATDYTMYVVRSEKTKIISVTEGLRKLMSVGIKVSGFIINDIDYSKNSFYARYYEGDYSSYY